jgi:hypothetical protein
VVFLPSLTEFALSGNYPELEFADLSLEALFSFGGDGLRNQAVMVLKLQLQLESLLTQLENRLSVGLLVLPRLVILLYMFVSRLL